MRAIWPGRFDVATCFMCRSEIAQGAMCPTCQATAKGHPEGPECLLTASDYAALQNLLSRGSDLHPLLRAAVRRKAAFARVMFPRDLPVGVVTLNSVVTYQLDDGPLATRILAVDQPYYPALPLASAVGVGLIGLRELEEARIQTEQGDEHLLRVVSVPYQPPPGITNPYARAKFVWLEANGSASVVPLVRRERRYEYQAGPDDDPGPSAA